MVVSHKEVVGAPIGRRERFRMSKPLTKSALSQKRVLDAAAKIFRDNGYVGTTMRAIAESADLKAGSIYYHYKSKDELIAAMLDLGISMVMQTVTDSLDTLGSATTGRQRIETAVTAHLTAIIAHGDYTLATRRVFGQVPETIRERNLLLRDRYAAIWREILETARDRGELRPDADITLARLFILGALNWTAEWFNPRGRSIDEVAKEFAAILCNGLFDQSAAPGSLRGDAPVEARSA